MSEQATYLCYGDAADHPELIVHPMFKRSPVVDKNSHKSLAYHDHHILVKACADAKRAVSKPVIASMIPLKSRVDQSLGKANHNLVLQMVTEAPVVFRCLLDVNDGADHKARGGSIMCNQINQRVCVFQWQDNPTAYRQGLTPEGEDGDASLVGGNGDEVTGDQPIVALTSGIDRLETHAVQGSCALVTPLGSWARICSTGSEALSWMGMAPIEAASARRSGT